MGILIGSFHFHGDVQPIALSPPTPRGIDVQGHWQSEDGRCLLGHTPLEMDTISGSSLQPISSHCKRYTLVMSGVIYNHLQVRSSININSWRCHTDRETLVEGLAKRGLAILLELRGMFVFAAYDNSKQQLILARDRLGIKPLYLSWQPHGLLFASERSALPGGHLLDRQTITQVLSFGHDRTPAHFSYPETHGSISLPAGLVVRINHSRPHDPVRYWPPQPRPDWTPLPIRDWRWARTFLRQQLEEVMAQHLLADVPVACLLSSGLDSGMLTALACRLQPGRIASFTLAFPDTKEDESQLVRQMARHCGSEHRELQLNDDQALAWLEAGLLAQDVPSADGLNTYLVSRAAAGEGIKVALSSLGADELFGGYPSHRLIPWLRHLAWLPPRLRHGLLRALSPRLAAKLQALPHWDCTNLALALRRWGKDHDLAAAGVERLIWPELPPQRISQVWGQISWAELFGYGEPMLLRNVDALSIASGLELRLPFLDHRLVEIALRMPQRFQSPGKGLLRAACSDLLPPGHLDHPKQGFALPMARWMLGPLEGLCRSRLQALQASGWLETGWITQQWQAFEAGQLHWPRAWSLVVLGEFASRNPTK